MSEAKGERAPFFFSLFPFLSSLSTFPPPFAAPCHRHRPDPNPPHWRHRARQSHRLHRRRGNVSRRGPLHHRLGGDPVEDVLGVLRRLAAGPRRPPASPSAWVLPSRVLRAGGTGGQGTVSPHRLRTDEAGGRARPGAVLGRGGPGARGLGASHRGVLQRPVEVGSSKRESGPTITWLPILSSLSSGG